MTRKFLRDRPVEELLIFIGFGASGFAGLVYEVVWSRALTNTIGGTVYSFSILLAAFLSGLAIGSRYGGRFLVNREKMLPVFGFLQLGIAIFGASTLYIINSLEGSYAAIFYQFRLSFAFFNVAQMVLVFLIMLIPTSLMGATFPVVVKAWSKREKEVGRSAGDVYAVNTWGAVFGALAAGFLLIPIAGLAGANAIAANINLTLAAVAFFESRSRRPEWFAAILIAAIMVTLLKGSPTGLRFGYGLADNYQSFASFSHFRDRMEVLFDKDGPYGRVQVFREEMQDAEGYQTLLVNGGRFEGSTKLDSVNQKLLAYLPLAIHNNPRTVLNIGLGTGMTLATAADDRRLESIDNVEINQLVYEAVDAHFYPGLFDNGRVQAITDDARHYLLLTHKKYDIIISEPSYPTSKVQAHLFTKKFYEIASRKLSKNGLFVQWLPVYLLKRNEVRSAVKTMNAVFPDVYTWDNVTRDLIIVGQKSSKKISPGKVRSRIKKLDEETLNYWRFVGGPKKWAGLLNDPEVLINSDNLPRIEFQSARNKIEGKRRILLDHQ